MPRWWSRCVVGCATDPAALVFCRGRDVRFAILTNTVKEMKRGW